MSAKKPASPATKPPEQRSLPRPVRHAMQQVAEDLSGWRRLRGLTQAQLAERGGVSLNTLRRLERGDPGVSIGNVLSVLRGLGVLEALPRALDPYETDIGRLRAEEHLPQRVRPRKLTGPDG